MNHFIENRHITCVEFYIINAVNKYFDIRKFFYKSYISSYKIYNDIYKENIYFANYNNIEKIQDTLIENDMLSYEVLYKIDAKSFKNKRLINLLLVNSSFYKNTNKAANREDHYIQIIKDNKSLKMINSYPISIKPIDINMLMSYFNHKCLLYKIKNKDKLSKKIVKEKFINHLLSINFYPIPEIYNIEIFQTLLQLLKITRLRLYDLCCYLKTSNLLIEYLKNINNTYDSYFIKTSMMIIKKNYNYEEINNMLYNINKLEYSLFKTFRKEFL